MLNHSVRNGLLGLFLVAISFVSCTEPDLIGIDLQPASDQPGVETHVLTVRSYTVQEDSLVVWSPTKNLIELPSLFLGSFDDPYIGKSFAGFVTQARIGNTITPTTFAGATTPDSIVLSFLYRSLEGDSNALHRISVYELGEKLFADSTYYSSRSFSKGNLLGHRELVPEITDSVVVGGNNLAPMLRIPLDTALGGKFMREYISNPAIFGDNAAFSDFFKGLLLTDSVDGSGSVLGLPSTSGYHRLTIYFSGNKSYEFLIDVNAVRFSIFKHEYLSFNTDLNEDDPMVVQSMAGLKDSLVIDNLYQLYADGPVSISSARLNMKVLGGTGANNLNTHNNLLIFASDSTGKNITTADATENASYYGGSYNATSGDYTFNIARYLQGTLNTLSTGGQANYGLFLVAGGSTSNARRTILQGGSTIQLIVTTTKLNR